MKVMHLILKSGLGAFLLSAVLAAAGPAELPRIVADMLVVNADKCVIYGTALDLNAAPLPDARVRLRNLETRTIEQVSTTNRLGEFVFVALPDVSYVVEIADRPGRVLAVGDVILIRAGEVAGSVIVVPPPIQGYAGLFRSTAAAVASAVAGTGLVWLAPDPPLSPEK
jgi:hypothetical protein